MDEHRCKKTMNFRVPQCSSVGDNMSDTLRDVRLGEVHGEIGCIISSVTTSVYSSSRASSDTSAFSGNGLREKLLRRSR